MTRYLLDTGVFLWSMGSPHRLSAATQKLLAGTENQFFLSAASSWEISIKSFLGKLRLPEPASTYVPKRLTQHGIRSLPMTQIHSLSAGELPLHHKDPFDRMLIAQALSENMTLMTTDRLLDRYHVEIFWCGP